MRGHCNRTRSSVTREYTKSIKICCMMHDPPDVTESTEMYIGRGSFLFRNVKVAVKELLPHSLLDDLNKEANILARFSHPYLPFYYKATQDCNAISWFWNYIDGH